MKVPYLLPILLILSTICCSCSEVIKGEQGSNYINAKLVDKGHVDFHNIDSHRTIYTIEFTNLTNEDKSQYEGAVKVFDIIGKEIASLEVKDTKGSKVQYNL